MSNSTVVMSVITLGLSVSGNVLSPNNNSELSTSSKGTRALIFAVGNINTKRGFPSEQEEQVTKWSYNLPQQQWKPHLNTLASGAAILRPQPIFSGKPTIYSSSNGDSVSANNSADDTANIQTQNTPKSRENTFLNVLFSKNPHSIRSQTSFTTISLSYFDNLENTTAYTLSKPSTGKAPRTITSILSSFWQRIVNMHVTWPRKYMIPLFRDVHHMPNESNIRGELVETSTVDYIPDVSLTAGFQVNKQLLADEVFTNVLHAKHRKNNTQLKRHLVKRNADTTTPSGSPESSTTSLSSTTESSEIPSESTSVPSTTTPTTIETTSTSVTTLPTSVSTSATTSVSTSATTSEPTSELTSTATATVSTSTPATTFITSIPSTTVTTSTPTSTVTSSISSTTDTPSTPATTVTTSIPSTTDTTSTQTSTVTSSISSTTVTTSTPATTVTTSIPSTTDTTSTQTSTVTSSISSTTDTPSTPSTTVTTSIPSTTDTTSIPSTTVTTSAVTTSTPTSPVPTSTTTTSTPSSTPPSTQSSNPTSTPTSIPSNPITTVSTFTPSSTLASTTQTTVSTSTPTSSPKTTVSSSTPITTVSTSTPTSSTSTSTPKTIVSTSTPITTVSTSALTPTVSTSTHPTSPGQEPTITSKSSTARPKQCYNVTCYHKGCLQEMIANKTADTCVKGTSVACSITILRGQGTFYEVNAWCDKQPCAPSPSSAILPNITRQYWCCNTDLCNHEKQGSAFLTMSMFVLIVSLSLSALV